MSAPGWNPHKKGEHVFNDIAGSLENALTAALATEKAHSLTLSTRHGNLELFDFPQTRSALDRFRNDHILVDARTIVAPASGMHDDINSRTYSAAKLKLEGALSEIVVDTAALLWKKKPRSNSSFLEFEAIVSGLKNASSLKADANSALDALIDSAEDPHAEASALAERISDTELARRRIVITSMKQHRPALKQAGHLLIARFIEELDGVLEARISKA
jgi:hypothetical protein